MSMNLADAPKMDRRLLLISGLLMLVWHVISWRFPFFWDAVLYSKMATWYLTTNYQELILPKVWDPGHPPFFGIYISLAWKLFGRSLVVAHVAMMPLIAIVVYQFQRLASRWLSPQGQYWAMALLFCEPTFFAQMGMLSPDIAILAFYMLALNSLIDGKRWMAALGMVLLGSVSVRGITMVPSLVLVEWLWARWQGRSRPDWKTWLAYLPFAGLTLIWMFYHHSHVGSWLSPPNQSYDKQRQFLGLAGMLRNVVVIALRWLDYGRVFLWLFVIGAALTLGLRKVWGTINLRKSMAAVTILLGLLAAIMIPFVNPPGHRYFLMGYLFLILVAVGLAELSGWQKRLRVGLVVVMLGLLSGHFWLYPKGVAQGWDSSLAHLPVFALQAQTRAYFQHEGIPANEVCADFPFLHPPYYTYVEPDAQDVWYKSLNEEGGCDWVICSNLINGYSDLQLAEFASPDLWELKQAYRSRGMYVEIYHRR